MSIRCVIDDNGIVNVELEEANGIITSKIITFEDLRESINIKSGNINLPLFPRGLRKIRKEGDTVVVAIEYEPCIMPEVITNSKYKDVPIPGSLWLHRLKDLGSGKYAIRKSAIFALQGSIMTGMEKLYHWPFTNYSASYGICWGSDSNYRNIANKTTLMNLGSIYGLYFSTRFNNDLGTEVNWRAMNGSEESRGSISSLFKHIAGKECYDPALLKGTTYTFDSAVSSFISNNLG